MDIEALDKAVRLKVYELLLAAGSMPRVQDVSDSLGQPIDVVGQALARLSKKRSLVLMPQSGEILLANPWSAVPTQFSVKAGGKDWYGICIWDALAIPAAMGAPGRVTTSCACCGEAMSIEVDGGRMVSGSGVVHIGLPAKQWWDDIVFT